MTPDQELYVLNALQVVGDWSVHDDGDGRLFYYDLQKDVSQWKAPQDLASLETEFMMKFMLQNAVARSGVWTAHDAGNGTLYYFNATTKVSVWERPMEWGKMGASEAEKTDKSGDVGEAVPSEKEKERKEGVKKKRKRKLDGLKKKEERLDEAKEEQLGKDAAEEEEADEEEPRTAEELQEEQEREARKKWRAEQFRTMLREKNIMPLCKWSVALPQIAGDPRFIGVPTMDERRAIFEHFVEHRRADLKAEKKSGLKRAKQLFMQLLREQFKLDSWEASTTLSVFLSTLEDNLDPKRYTDIQDNALELLTLSTQEKMYAKAVAEFKSDALKRDGEQLRLTRFLEDRLPTEGRSSLRWEEDRVQSFIREFYSSADTGGALLLEQKQRQVFDELVVRIAHGQASERGRTNGKQAERSHSSKRLQSRDHSRGKVGEASPLQERCASKAGRHRSRSRSLFRRRRSCSSSRSQSQERTSGHRRRRSPSRSRSRGRPRRRTSKHHRDYSSSPTMSR
uniref:WW domain-containing protein n=1 Tax=Hyaloperonospora arabidopsidis (strain Emoy2) TaxID=559515 RepID=M4BKV6_HYAAE